jgi:PAS domain S-box-containing protein
MTIQLSDAINSVTDVIFYKDSSGVYQGGNLAWEKLLGKPLSQMIGKTDFDLFPKEVAEFFRQKDQEMLEEGKERINQEELIYPDGHKVMVETLKSPIRNQQGQVIGLVGICRASK